MAHSAEFRRELNALFERRTYWLLKTVETPSPGSPPSLSRKNVRKTVSRLQEIASAALAHRWARARFKEAVEQKRRWHPKKGKGRGFEAKRSAFKAWYLREIGRANCIYVFWNGRSCVYVGKTTKGAGRITSHFEKTWFQPVSRVDVYRTKGRRNLPALECLAIHRFRPRRNKFRAEERRWTTKCPLCRVHRQIDAELSQIFRLR